MIVKALLLFFSIVSTPSEAFQILEPGYQNAMNVMAEAESFASARGTSSHQLLILMTGTLLLNESMKLNSSLLVLEAPTRFDSEFFYDAIPLYLDVLAADLVVIVVSSNNPPPIRAFQNFRHKLLLHICLLAKSGKEEPAALNTLYWYANQARRFVCVNSFDNINFWHVNATMDTCAKKKSGLCSMVELRTWRLSRDVPMVVLHTVMECETVLISTNLQATKFARTPFQQSMLFRYSTSRSDTYECFSFIHWRETDVSAFFRPFKYEVWVLFIVTALVMSKITSSLGTNSFASNFSRAILSLISVMDIKAENRRWCQMIASGSVVVMCFFVAQIYTNFVMVYFLNPQVFHDCVQSFDCNNVISCYSKHFLDFMFAGRKCVCNLNPKQTSKIGKPLHRKSYSTDDAARNLSREQNFMYIQKYDTPQRGRRLRDRGQYFLVPGTVSTTVDRLIENGFLSRARFEPTEEEVGKYLKGSTNYLFISLRTNWTAERLKDAIGFDAAIDRFDMDGFRKLQPVLAVNVVVLVTCFVSELVPIGYRKLRGLFSAFGRRCARVRWMRRFHPNAIGPWLRG